MSGLRRAVLLGMFDLAVWIVRPTLDPPYHAAYNATVRRLRRVTVDVLDGRIRKATAHDRLAAILGYAVKLDADSNQVEGRP